MKFTYGIALSIICYLIYSNISLLAPSNDNKILPDYFPDSAINSNKLDYYDYWISYSLYQMNEPSLFEMMQINYAQQTYRLQLWPALGNISTVIRVEVKSDGSGALIFKELERERFSEEYGELITHFEKKLSKAEILPIQEFFGQKGFWDSNRLLNGYSISEKEDKSNIAISDGTRWIIEGINNDRYYIMERTSPGFDWPEAQDGGNRKALYKIGLYLRDLAS